MCKLLYMNSTILTKTKAKIKLLSNRPKNSNMFINYTFFLCLLLYCSVASSIQGRAETNVATARHT